MNRVACVSSSRRVVGADRLSGSRFVVASTSAIGRSATDAVGLHICRERALRGLPRSRCLAVARVGKLAFGGAGRDLGGIRLRSSAFIRLAASVVVGCGQLLPSSLLAAKSAENPLQGAALEWTRAPSGVPFEGARACTIWPIQDALTASATTDKICVMGQVHLLPPSVTPPAVDTVVVHRWRRNERAARRPRGSDLVCRAEEARRVHRLRRSEEHLGSPLRWMHRQQGQGRQAVGFVDVDVLGYRARALAIRQWGDACVRAVCGSCEIGGPAFGGAVSREIRRTTARIPFLAGASGAVSTLGDPVECAIWHAKRSAVELWGLHGGERASQVCALPNWQCRLLRFGLVVCGSSTLRISVPRRAIERVRWRSVAG